MAHTFNFEEAVAELSQALQESEPNSDYQHNLISEVAFRYEDVDFHRVWCSVPLEVRMPHILSVEAENGGHTSEILREVI